MLLNTQPSLQIVEIKLQWVAEKAFVKSGNELKDE